MAKGSSELVLLTGATGFLGYLTLLELLRAGYRVRAAVRSTTKLGKLRNAPSLKALNPSEEQLSFVTVPDMTAPGAYDAAVAGVSAIVHIASPIPSFGEGEPPKPEELEESFLGKTKAGVFGMLHSAKDHAGPQLRRIVLTSSTVANTHFSYFMNQGKDIDTRVFTPDDRIPVAPGPFGFEFQAYSSGKAAALNGTDDFVKNEKPAFDVISILPSWIFGYDELVTDAENMRVGSTNSVLMAVLLGTQSDQYYTGNAVKGTDVATAHVRALNPEVKAVGNQSFVVNTNMTWEDAITIAKKYHPEAFEKGQLSADGKQPTLPMKWDTSRSERVLGMKFASFDSMVKDVTDQYLELLAKE